jgi:SNF2 family DNA or RNA helicase
VWPDEIKKWAEFADITYTVVHGSKKHEALAEDVDIYIVNPEGLKWLFSPAMRTRLPEWDVLIVDESTKFKDSSTQRFKALKPFLQQFTRRWILTGTPVPNGLMDLFGQMYILDLGRSLGRFITHYRNEFFTPSGYGGYDWKPRPDAFDEIVERISPLILQMSAADYLEMPELVIREVPVSLPAKVQKQYESLEDEFLLQLDSGTEIAALNAAAAGTKLRQIANGAVYTADSQWEVLHDEKLDALESLLEELNGHPILLLYEFQHDHDRIMRRFDHITSLRNATPAKFEKSIDLFNSGGVSILLGHPQSMGHGLNLQGACHHVIWFGMTWNLEHYDQAIARVWRQGQKNEHVFIYHIIAKDTKDEDVSKVLAKKGRDQGLLQSALKSRRESLAA